jgi:hypothetical protein
MLYNIYKSVNIPYIMFTARFTCSRFIDMCYTQMLARTLSLILKNLLTHVVSYIFNKPFKINWKASCQSFKARSGKKKPYTTKVSLSLQKRKKTFISCHSSASDEQTLLRMPFLFFVYITLVLSPCHFVSLRRSFNAPVLYVSMPVLFSPSLLSSY